MTEFIKGVKIEVGAEFLHGSDTELTRFAKATGEPITEIYCWAHGDGGPLQEPVRKGYGLYYIGDKAGTGKDSLLRYDDKDPEFQRMNETLWGLKTLKEEDYDLSYSLADYLGTKGFGADMIRMAEAGFSNTLCATSSGLSLRRVIKWTQLWEQECEEDGDYSFDNSWSSLVSHLKQNLQIELRCPVSDIQYIPQQSGRDAGATAPFSDLVKVKTKAGATYYTKSVVVTSSPHVLRREVIKFDPPMSQELKDSVNSVNMNSIVKVFLKFSQPVWPKNLSGMIISDKDFLLPEIWFRDVSNLAAEDEPAKAYAVAFTTAEYAAKLSAMPRHEVLKSAIDQFDKMFSLLEPQHMAADPADPLQESPRQLPKPSDALLGVMYWDWTPEHHPYIGGGYCSPKAGTDADLIDKLRLPYGNNNIFFAGEATNLPGATAHAALESGVRAAEQAASVIKKSNSK